MMVTGKWERPYKLFTPGPVNIPLRVALAETMTYYHRSSEFAWILGETLEMLRPLFGTERQIYPIHATGRGAIEGVVTNLLTKKDRVLAVANGFFGEMGAKILEKNGIPTIRIFEDWTHTPQPDELEELIRIHRPTAIYVVHNETSSSLVNPIAEIGKISRRHGLLLIVDSVSGIGSIPFLFDAWGADAVVTASQKGLMCPPGLSFFVMSERAEKICESNGEHGFYIDLKGIRDQFAKNGQTPGTTPFSLVLAAHEAAAMIHEEGIEKVFERHRELSRRTKAAVEEMGYSLFPPQAEQYSDGLTAFLLPEGQEAHRLVEYVKERYHLQLGKGLGKYADSVIRIAHMGCCYEEDMLQCIAAVEASMEALGWIGEAGRGIRAFIKTGLEEEKQP